MQISKIVGYCLVLLGSSGLGVWYSMQMRKRVFNIKEMIRILDLVKSEMNYHHSTLPECCGLVFEKAKEPYKTLFYTIHETFQQGNGRGLDILCEEVLEEGLQKLPLKEEKELFIQCFSDIGYSDVWMQYQNMERNEKQLKGILDTEEMEMKTRSKLAISLGTMSGILLVLILL